MRHDLPDVYDDRPLREPRPPRSWPWVVALLVLAGGGFSAWHFWKPAPPPPPAPAAAAINVPPKDQAAAMRALRQRLAQTAKSECIAILGAGSDARAYVFTAVNRCENKPLGKWRVERRTGAISPR